jgi:hypothetical protein
LICGDVVPSDTAATKWMKPVGAVAESVPMQ